MKETKLKERFTHAFDAFFGNEKVSENTVLEFTNDRSIFHENESIATRNTFIWKIFKQLFFFLPGTFATFFLWMELMVVRNIPYLSPIFWLFLLLPPFLMVMGMGNVKKFKHWLMPLNVIILGSFLGIVLSSIPMLKNFFASNGNVLLLLPLALITAILSKNLVDKPEENI